MRGPARILLCAACAALVLAVLAEGLSAATVVGFRDRVIITAAIPGVTAADRVVYQKLDTTIVSFTFNEQPLEEAVEFLSTLGGVNIVIDKRKVESGKTVTLKLANVPLATAVKLLTEQVGLKWRVRDGLVFISDEEGTKAEPVTVVYDVSDLLAVPPNFVGPTIELQSIGGNRGGQGTSYPPTIIGEPADGPKDDSQKSREELLQELVDLIKQVIEAGTWEEGTR